MRTVAYAVPWSRKEFEGWSIVGMNHYNFMGARALYVAMVKGDRCIKEEGIDEKALWEKLAAKASSIDSGGG